MWQQYTQKFIKHRGHVDVAVTLLIYFWNFEKAIFLPPLTCFFSLPVSSAGGLQIFKVLSEIFDHLFNIQLANITVGVLNVDYYYSKSLTELGIQAGKQAGVIDGNNCFTGLEGGYRNTPVMLFLNIRLKDSQDAYLHVQFLHLLHFLEVLVLVPPEADLETRMQKEVVDFRGDPVKHQQ